MNDEKTTPESQHALRVLIVEDSPNDTELMIHEIQRGGFDLTWKRVDTESTMKTALDAEPWDAVVSDFSLPHFDGRRALRVLQDSGLDIPFIIVSGKIGEETAVAALHAGAHDYLMKDNLTRLVPALKRELRDATARKERHRAEAALRESEARQAKMVANIRDVIVIMDQDGINRYKSPNITKWFGWKPEEVVGCGALDNVHSDDVNRAQELIDHLMSEPNRTETIECRYRCKDGSYKWIEFAGINLLHDADIQGILGNYHDITERKTHELNQQRLNERLAEAQRIAGTGDWVWDAKADKVTWSENLFAILGVPPDQAVPDYEGQKRLYHPDDQDLFDKTVSHTLETGESFSMDLRRLRPDGQEIVIHSRGQAELDDDGNITTLYGTVLDITERKRDEQKLAESEERFRSTVNDLQVGVVVHAADTSIILCNPAAADMLGVNPEEVIGKVNTDLAWHFLREDRSELPLEEFPVNQVMTKGQMILNQVFGIMQSDRENPIWCNCTAVPVFDPENQISRIIVNFMDISELKQIEQSLISRNDELKRFNKVAVGRELRMVELKEEINTLCAELGKPNRYR